MKLSMRLLIAAGLLGLMVAPAFVNAAGVGGRCVGSVSAPAKSCKIISDKQLVIFATGAYGASVTLQALAVVDGVERTLAKCSFGGSDMPQEPTITPSPASIRVEVEVSPAPTPLPTIRETVEPGPITADVVPNSGPGACSTRATTDPGLEVKCIANGAGRATFGCVAYDNE